jgi:hypothetical protein
MRVLIALDRTEEAERAATVIARWASGRTLDVHLLHVLTMFTRRCARRASRSR